MFISVLLVILLLYNSNNHSSKMVLILMKLIKMKNIKHHLQGEEVKQL